MYFKTAERTITMIIKPKIVNIRDSGVAALKIVIVETFSIDTVVEVMIAVKVFVIVVVYVLHIVTREISVAYDAPMVE
jgi:hypothetical protein